MDGEGQCRGGFRAPGVIGRSGGGFGFGNRVEGFTSGGFGQAYGPNGAGRISGQHLGPQFGFGVVGHNNRVPQNSKQTIVFGHGQQQPASFSVGGAQHGTQQVGVGGQKHDYHNQRYKDNSGSGRQVERGFWPKQHANRGRAPFSKGPSFNHIAASGSEGLQKGLGRHLQHNSDRGSSGIGDNMILMDKTASKRSFQEVEENRPPSKKVEVLVETKKEASKPQGELFEVAEVSAKGRGKWCFRCRTKGHVSVECTTILFCQLCESDDHVAAICPIKKKPRLMAYSVGYAMDGLGFYHIPHGPISMSKKDNTLALITVMGGELKEAELVAHMERLIPGKHGWDVQLHAPNTWVANFPSKAELKRTVTFGSADLKNGLLLKFEEFEEEEYCGEELPRVWMRVLNLPKGLRTYEVLWAIGTMFGATTKVDMITTRKNTFGRFEVAVLNASIVPNQMEVVIGTRWFELVFEIEGEIGEAMEPITHRENGNEGDHPDGRWCSG
jgi:hypothetical protein